MAFLETPIFPGSILVGATRTVRSSVEVARQFNRRAVKNLNAQAWREYTFPLAAKTASELETIEAHYLAVGCTANAFRLQDWADYTCSQADGYLGQTAIGTGYPTYQLHKRYVTGSMSQFRAIRKPKSSGYTIYRNGGPAVEGASAGQYGLSSTTGIVTWVADGSQSVSSHTVGASHIVTLSSAIAGLAIGGRLYLTGVTGTAATLLNSIAHPITNVAGAVYTLSTSTTGLTATGGTGFKYPQPTDTLAWAGSFDTPVAYDAELQFQNIKSNMHLAQNIVLVEEYV